MREQHSALNARDDMLWIADAWPDLLVRLGRDSTAPDEKVRGTRPVGLVINEHVSQTMQDVTTWANFLARVLVDETDWTPPPGADTPTLLADIARRRIGHFTEHEDEGLRLSFYDDVASMRQQVQRAAYPSGRRWVPLHVACLEHDTTDLGERVPCEGEYRVLLDPDRPGVVPDMVCELDPSHRISPLDWQRAARKSGYDPEQIRERLAAARGSA